MPGLSNIAIFKKMDQFDSTKCAHKKDPLYRWILIAVNQYKNIVSIHLKIRVHLKMDPSSGKAISVIFPSCS